MSEERVTGETQPVWDPNKMKFVRVPRPAAVSGGLAPTQTATLPAPPPSNALGPFTQPPPQLAMNQPAPWSASAPPQTVLGPTLPTSYPFPTISGGPGLPSDEAEALPHWVPSDLRHSILSAAKANNIDPTLLARLVGHESSFNQNAVGSAGEIGLGQLLPGTAKELGVDPSDVNQNLMGAAKYLRQQLDNPKSGGDVRKALMMYNGGPGVDFSDPGHQQYPKLVLSYGGGGTTTLPGVSPDLRQPVFAGPSDTPVVDTAALQQAMAQQTAQMQQQEQRQRTLMALSMVGAMNRGITFHPIQYDPWANVPPLGGGGRFAMGRMPQEVGWVGRKQLGPVFDPTMERVGSAAGMRRVLAGETPEPIG